MPIDILSDPRYAPLIIFLAIWSLCWKSCALWIAARQSQKVWFGFMMVLNTLGILEILYIFIFSKRKKVNQV